MSLPRFSLFRTMTIESASEAYNAGADWDNGESFEDFLSRSGISIDQAQPAPTPEAFGMSDQPSPTPAPVPMIADSRHVYVGTDNRGDVYQLVDETGSVVEWAVKVNDSSAAIIPGTVQNLGNPSAGTIAQGPAYVPPVGSGVTAAPVITPAATVIGADPRHKYVGTDNRGDVYQLVDENGNVMEWAVKINDDSRNLIPGSVRNLGAPSSMTTAQGPAYQSPPYVPVLVSNPSIPPVTGPMGAPGAVRQNPNQNTTAYANQGGQPQQSDRRHVYVGRDHRGDIWQIFDGANVIEWAVQAGDLSGNIIKGSEKFLGPPSAATKAQNDGTPVGGPIDTTLSPKAVFADTLTASQGGASVGLTVAGIAATLLSTMLK